MSMDTHIKDILELAVWAPSGDNSQPWRFVVKGNEVNVYNLPDRDNPVLNFRQAGSYVAHGGLIENAVIAASVKGYRAIIRLFPDKSDPTFVATLVFEKANVAADLLWGVITTRHTNRKPYRPLPLTQEERNALLSVVPELGLEASARVGLIEDAESRKRLGAAGASVEQVILENRELHGILFKDVVWSEKEELEKHSGLYLDAMEFSPPQRALFGLARRWSFMRVANAIGFPKFISWQDAKIYATGSALGAVIMKSSGPEDFVNAGRIMQRLWLRVTACGLWLHPITALLFAAARVRAGEASMLSAAHRELIEREYREVEQVFGASAETVAMMFRIGHADPPRAHSSRRAPDILIG